MDPVARVTGRLFTQIPKRVPIAEVGCFGSWGPVKPRLVEVHNAREAGVLPLRFCQVDLRHGRPSGCSVSTGDQSVLATSLPFARGAGLPERLRCGKIPRRSKPRDFASPCYPILEFRRLWGKTITPARRWRIGPRGQVDPMRPERGNLGFSGIVQGCPIPEAIPVGRNELL